MRPFPFVAALRRSLGAAWGTRVLTFARFGTVGLLTAAIYGGVLALSVETAKQPPAFGAGLAYLIAIAFNYLAHYGWTFRSDASHIRTASRYIIVIGAIFCANVIATWLLPKFLNVSYISVQVGLAICAVGGSFLSQYLWVFRPRPPDAVASPIEKSAH